MAILHPQECWLLERIMSPEYYRRRFEGWQEFVELCERQVAEWSKTMPLDVRRRPLCEQIDAVWGGRVLPNIRSTLKSVQYDFIQLQQGDLRVLQSGGNISSDMKGLIDYPSDWMSLVAQKQYDRLKWRGAHYNNLIRRTSGGYWYDGELTYYYEESLHGPLALPMQLPLYELDSRVYLREDDPVTLAGLYLPDIPDASAQLLYRSEHIPEAWQGHERSMSMRLGYKNITGKTGRGKNATGYVYGGWQTDLSMCRRRDFSHRACRRSCTTGHSARRSM